MNNKKAFTLAETLMTLMIIGVVSAMTIPLLKDSSDQKANIAGLQKAESTASNLFLQVQAVNGPPIYWHHNNVSVFASNGSIISQYLSDKMNVIQSSVDNGYTPKALNNTTITDGASIDGSNIRLSSVKQTADGMYWFFSDGNTGCSGSNRRCGLIMVDTNGPKKPNKMGGDLFVLEITPDGVRPLNVGDCSDVTQNGYGCAGQFAQNSKALDFIYKD